MERSVTLKKDENKLTVSVLNARSIDILDPDSQVVGRVKSDKLAGPEAFYLEPGKYKIVTDGKIEDVKIESEDIEQSFEPAELIVTSDAKDFHVVDGVGEIPADGESSTTITVLKTDASGKPLALTKDNDQLFLRTNAGIIKNVQGKKEIRSLKLNKGQGAFRLYSEKRKRVATVQVISADDFLTDASIKIEFF